MEALVEKVHARAKELVISQPFDEDPKPFMGPLISATAKERFLRYNTIAESEGAELIMRPKALEGATRQNRKPLPPGHYVSPAINVVSKWDSRSAYQTHEILGPDIFFCKVESLEEGVAAINSAGYGLVSSLYGGDEQIFKEAADSIEAGLIYWNRGTVGGNARLPFGGWKKSGNHRPAGLFAIYSTSQVQVRVRSSS
jgi:succinylglutamic semialdehyde dehydrogenase